MSKKTVTPEWMNRELTVTNVEGNKLGTKTHKKKSGRKKSIVSRSSLMMVTSDWQATQFKKLETALIQNGIEISRGRSQTLELAAAYLLHSLKDEESKGGVIAWLSAINGLEERMAEQDLEAGMESKFDEEKEV
ncbi:hypothetical protein KFE26_23090 [Shewanella sp. M16]|uniref:hypothetical protein n=1 Tax=Shewanella sp. M16 TaxID=2830837 RepID=UPI001BB0580E|nr:hypothetical protein [Shewanella sp. M16]MBS0045137.1 hypothetical protein [Shewanella sp. M16]